MKKMLFTLLVAVCSSNSFAYYQAQQGRWMSRDPLGEIIPESRISVVQGSTAKMQVKEGYQQAFRGKVSNDPKVNLIYGFVSNNPINSFDLLGLRDCSHKSGYTPSSNGCGPASPKWMNWAVPEGFFPSLGGYSFTPACNAHDICYGTCCSDKSKCDSDFLAGMKSQCDKWVDKLYGAGGVWSWVGDGALKELDRKACYLDAYAFHAAVAKGGQKAFDAAQKAACKCPPKP